MALIECRCMLIPRLNWWSLQLCLIINNCVKLTKYHVNLFVCILWFKHKNITYILEKKIIPYQWRKFHKAYACILCFTIEIHDPPQTIPNISAQFNLYQKLLILWTKLYLKYTKTFIWKRYYQMLHPPFPASPNPCSQSTGIHLYQPNHK